jgi:hypothetical protein
MEEREMQTSLPNLLALTLGTLLMTMQGPAMAQNLQINPAQQPAAAQGIPGQAVAAPAGPAAGAPAAAVAPVQAGAVATTTVASQTAMATTSTTTVETQMDLLPARTVLGSMLQMFNSPPGFGGRSRCGHVIDMLMEQHLQTQFFGGNVQNMQQPASIVAFDPFGRPIVRRMGDLRLISVDMITDATPEMGPLYEVTILNDSVRDAIDFRVSLVAVHGGILPNSPTVTMNVDEIAAGGTATLQVQMPQACLAIEVTGQAPAPFDMLVVAIDSFDELMEGNELNNVAVLERSDIVIEGATETAVTTEAVQSTTETPEDAPAAAAPVDNGQVAPVDNGQAAPVDNGAAAPDADDDDDQLDFENLGLDEADEAESTFFTGQ